MTTDPILSIITITKNNGAGLRGTYGNLLAQSIPFESGYEWMIVDGQSHDDTSAFITKEGLKKNFYSSKDDGIYDAMNRGMSLAQGHYIMFLNAGDRLADADTLSLILKHLRQTEADFVYGDALEEWRGKPMIKKSRPHTTIARGLFTSHQAMLYKRAAIGDLKYGTSFKIAGDYDFTARFLQRCDSIDYIPAGVCVNEPGGISQTNAALGRREELRAKIDGKICSRPVAYLIYMKQSLSMMVRNTLPGLYWRFR